MTRRIFNSALLGAAIAAAEPFALDARRNATERTGFAGLQYQVPNGFQYPEGWGPGVGNSFFVNGNPVINNLQQANQYAVNLNKYEILQQSLYDSQVYPAAGTTQLTFFQSQVGSGVAYFNTAATKSPEDTNMQGNGMLPAMQAYVVTSIELDVQTGLGASGAYFPAAAQPSVYGAGAVASAVNDMWKIRSTGWCVFNVGSKDYMTEGPLMKFPASNDFDVEGNASDTTTAGATQAFKTTFGKAIGPAYSLAPNNLLLIPNQNFKGTLNWQTVVTVTTQARVFYRLMGQLLRSAQ